MQLLPLAWTLTVDPLTTALGFVHLQVEHTLGPHFSLYASPSLRLYDGLLAGTNGPYRGYGVEMGLRGFFVGQAPEGGWVMWRGVVAAVVANPPRSEVNPGGYTSLLVGYTWIHESGFTLSGGAGASWFNYGVNGDGVHGFAPALHTNLGWAF